MGAMGASRLKKTTPAYDTSRSNTASPATETRRPEPSGPVAGINHAMRSGFMSKLRKGLPNSRSAPDRYRARDSTADELTNPVRLAPRPREE